MKPPADIEVPDRYPPLSVWKECDAAAGRARELRAEGRELHFELDEVSGRLAIELRALDGQLLRKLSVGEAMAIAAGEPA